MGSGLSSAGRAQWNITTFYVTERRYATHHVKGSLYLWMNPRQHVDLCDSRREEAGRAMLTGGETIKSGLEKCFDQHGKVGLKVLDQAEEFDGCSSALSRHAPW